MGKPTRDVVYILKNDIKPDELRYSLRSVCENFPCRKVVFVGGCPKDIKPDLYIPHIQVGDIKWQRAVSSMKKAFIDDRISDEFFLFNDDFFILKPVDTENFINHTNGTLGKKVADLEKGLKKNSSWTKGLKALNFQLRTEGYDTMSYAVHMPFLINKFNAMELMNKYPDSQMFRSLYGNVYKSPYIFHEDVKVFSKEKLPKFDDYLSTSDDAFSDGIVGDFIKNRFQKRCRYEKYEKEDIKELYTEEGDDRYDIIP